LIEKYLWIQETKVRYAGKTRELCRQEVSRELMTAEEKWGRLKRIVLGTMIKKRIKKKELVTEIGGTENVPRAKEK